MASKPFTKKRLSLPRIVLVLFQFSCQFSPNPAVANPPPALSLASQPLKHHGTTTTPPALGCFSGSQAAGSAISGQPKPLCYLVVVVILQPERQLHGLSLGSRQGLLGNLHYQPVKALASFKLFFLCYSEGYTGGGWYVCPLIFLVRQLLRDLLTAMRCSGSGPPSILSILRMVRLTESLRLSVVRSPTSL